MPLVNARLATRCVTCVLGQGLRHVSRAKHILMEALALGVAQLELMLKLAKLVSHATPSVSHLVWGLLQQTALAVSTLTTVVYANTRVPRSHFFKATTVLGAVPNAWSAALVPPIVNVLTTHALVSPLATHVSQNAHKARCPSKPSVKAVPLATIISMKLETVLYAMWSALVDALDRKQISASDPANIWPSLQMAQPCAFHNVRPCTMPGSTNNASNVVICAQRVAQVRHPLVAVVANITSTKANA